MSGKWAEFDPLSRARAKPAAPVTSLEQAEVRPAVSQPSPRRSEPSSPTAADPARDDSTPGDAASRAGSQGPDEKQEPESAAQSPARDDTAASRATGKHEAALSETGDNARDAANADEDEKAEKPKNDEKRERSRSEPGGDAAAETSTETPTETPTAETKPKPESRAPDAQDAAPSEAAPDSGLFDEPEAEAGTEANSAQPIDTSDIRATAASGGGDNDNGETRSQAAEEWRPAKLELNANDAEPHVGDLRKNSIAAMKELGSPDAREAGMAAPEEDMPFDFQRFMGLLRSRSADPIARYVKSFLQEFSRGVWSPAQQEKIVADFQKFITVKMREFEPFASLSKRDRRNAAEGMEKLVMNRLYTRTFPPQMPPILRTDGHNEDLLRDQVFEERLRLWSWVEGRHLDINEAYLQSGFIQLAANELVRLHQFKSPRDKTICILNCSKVVWALIRQAQLEQNADSFLPLLIYVVLKAQPAHLVSNLNYIQRFRAREFQKGEAAYYLSTLASAVTFLDTLDKSSLTISDDEFNQKMEASIRAENERKAKQHAEQRERPPHAGDDAAAGLDAHEGESSAAVLAASAGMLVERMRNFTSKFIEDLSTPEEADAASTRDGDGTSDAAPRAAGQTRRQFRDEEQAAREASRAEFHTEQLQRQQFTETSETLQQMFPALDADVVDDVLRQCGTNIGSAVDLCLALVGTT